MKLDKIDIKGKKTSLEVLDKVGKVVANSEYTKNLAIKVGVNEDKIIVINPGIDSMKNLDQKINL